MKRKLAPATALALVLVLSLACLPHLQKAKQFYAEGQDQARRFRTEAVMARELGLPSEKILRDNDNKVVFCFVRLKETLPAVEWESFAEAHSGWTKKWGWRDARTPAWKKE